MAVHNVSKFTLTRAQLSDLFAEAERRIRAGEDGAPPVVDLLSLPEAGVVHADYLITLACQQAVVGHFDAACIAAGHASSQADTGPAMCAKLLEKAELFNRTVAADPTLALAAAKVGVLEAQVERMGGHS